LGFAEENCGVAASVFSRKLNFFEKILKYFFITFLPFFALFSGFKTARTSSQFGDAFICKVLRRQLQANPHQI
jgi:hypothetical protein